MLLPWRHQHAAVERTGENPSILLLCLFSCLLFAGCSRQVHYQSNAERLATALLTEIETVEQSTTVDGETGALHLTYRQACYRAAVTDGTVQTILADIRKSNIDLVEAGTQTWPRLSAQAQAEIPLDNDSSSDADLTGGLYFKYDIWRAVAEPDEVALRKALVEKNLQKLRLHINGLAGDIARHLTTMTLLEFRLAEKKEALELARQGLELVEIFARRNQSEGLDLLFWKKNVHTLNGELIQLEQLWREENNNLLTLVGVGHWSTLIITDADTVIAGMLRVPDAPPAPSAIWAKHSEARLVEIEYVAAEVNIRLAEMDRLPKLNATLGLGSIPLTSGDGETASLFQLRMELPLWDAGDHERKLARAKIDRGLVRERMQTKAVSLWRRARQAQLLYDDSLQQKAFLTQFLEETLSLHDGRKLLAEEGRLNTLDLFRDRIELADVAIMEKEATLKVREAAAGYRLASGLDIVDGMVAEIEGSLLAHAMDLEKEISISGSSKDITSQ